MAGARRTTSSLGGNKVSNLASCLGQNPANAGPQIPLSATLPALVLGTAAKAAEDTEDFILEAGIDSGIFLLLGYIFCNLAVH